jgi:hypothetical protein
MPITFRSTFNAKRTLDRKLDAVESALTRQIELEKTAIVARTGQGKDVDGARFEDYSDAYAKRRADAGRQVSPPNLTFTGQMLQAIVTQVVRARESISARIYFADTESAAKARYNNPTRRFFGLADSQLARLKRAVREALKST